MFLDDEQVANGRVDETIFVLLVRRGDFRYRLTSHDQYASPFKFAGSLTKIEVDIARTNFCQLDQDRIREARRAAADAEE
jgi:hypothetical protein